MQQKVAIFVFSDTETFEGLGRVFNALVAAKEFAEGGDDVRIVFDGAGTKWPAALSRADHKAHGLYQAVSSRVSGACAFCAGVLGAADGVKASGTPLLEEYEGHPSLRQLLTAGYQILSF